jgi:hypothetical protein
MKRGDRNGVGLSAKLGRRGASRERDEAPGIRKERAGRRRG